MILVVNVEDEGGHPLNLYNGSTVPGWGGEYAGSPGIAFAKILRDVDTGESPVVSYWKQTLIVSDNRIPALGTDITHYTFDIPDEGGDLHLTAKLFFRRTFQSIAVQKGWDIPDILMGEKSLTFSPTIHSDIYLPLVISDTPQ
jgi:hypothetical protein